MSFDSIEKRAASLRFNQYGTFPSVIASGSLSHTNASVAWWNYYFFARTIPLYEESLFLFNLKTLISKSTTFQDWVGATGSATEKQNTAKSRIYIKNKKENQVEAPFCIIDYQDGIMTERISINGYLSRTTMWMCFVNNYAGTERNTDFEEEQYKFTNKTGAIRNEMLELSWNGAGNLIVESISWGEWNPTFPDKNEKNKEISVSYFIQTGI